MCDPVTAGTAAAGLALSAGGAMAKSAGGGEQSAARQAVIDAENRRQLQYQNEGMDVFNSTIPKVGVDAQNANRQAATDRRVAADTASLEAPGGVTAAPTAPGSGQAGSFIARAISDALDRGKTQSKLNAAVSGYGDSTARAGVDLGRAGQWQQIIGTKMHNSAGLVPGELDYANRAGAGTRGLGDILGAAGGAVSSAGLASGGGSWSDLFGNGAPIAGVVGPQQQGIFSRIFR